MDWNMPSYLGISLRHCWGVSHQSVIFLITLSKYSALCSIPFFNDLLGVISSLFARWVRSYLFLNCAIYLLTMHSWFTYGISVSLFASHSYLQLHICQNTFRVSSGSILHHETSAGTPLGKNSIPSSGGSSSLYVSSFWLPCARSLTSPCSAREDGWFSDGVWTLCKHR